MAGVCQNSLYKLNRNVDATFKRRTFFFFFCPNAYNTLFDLDVRRLSQTKSRLLSISRINQKAGLSVRDAEHYNHSYSTSFLSWKTVLWREKGVGWVSTEHQDERGKKKKHTLAFVYSAVFPAGEHFLLDINQPRKLTNAERHRGKKKIFFLTI